MGVMDDILEKTNNEYKKRYKENGNFSAVLKSNVTFENCEELSKVYNFLKEHNYPTAILEENIKSLKIMIDSQLNSRGSSANGCITIRSLNDQDVIIHEMFHQASEDFLINDSGIIFAIGDKSSGVALNEGITDYLANKVDKKYRPQYEFEFMVAKRLIEGFGLDILKGYFDADRSEFEESFSPNCINIIRRIIKDLDMYEKMVLSAEFDKASSYIIDIEMCLVKLGLNTIDLSNFENEINSESRSVGN